MTARQISAAAGISEATLSKWRHGDRPGDRARVEATIAEVGRRLRESGIESAFIPEARRLVDGMFPVELASAADPEPHLRAADLLWAIPLLYHLTFFGTRWVVHLAGGDSTNPFSDGTAGFVMLVATAGLWMVGPIATDGRRYRAFLTRWAAGKGLADLVRSERSTPSTGVRSFTVLLAFAVAAIVVLPEYRLEAEALARADDTPSWAEPRFRLMYEGGFFVMAAFSFDLVLSAVWRLAYWAVTVTRIAAAGRFEVTADRSDGGWWPPLRAGYGTIVTVAVGGVLFRALVSPRSTPLDQQPQVGLVRVIGSVLLLEASLLIFALYRAHDHRSAGSPEAMQLSLAFIPATLVAAGMIGVLFLD